MKTTNKIGLFVLVTAAIAVGIGVMENSPPTARAVPPELLPGADGCPDGAGPEMVRLPEGFCIDTTEVTRGQYDAWLATSPATTGQPTSCAENTDFEPACDSGENNPVVCVDWCDATAYCAAAGKRLCGGVSDGAGYDFNAYADPAVSEWHAACTSGGANAYTYGNELDTQTCRGGDAEDYTTWGFVDVGTLPGCRSPESAYSAVYDLSGNAAEWDNACDGDDPDSPCRIRGGSFEFNDVGLRCSMAENLRWPRMRKVVSVGIRCCAD